MKDVAQRHQPAAATAAALREMRAPGGALSAQLAGSPRQLAQGWLMGHALGQTVQRVESEPEETERRASPVRGDRGPCSPTAVSPLRQSGSTTVQAAARGRQIQCSTGASATTWAFPQLTHQPVQRKVRIAADSKVVDSVEQATLLAGQDCTPVATALASSGIFTVKTVDALRALAAGNEADVLKPRKHVIGEVHTASQFDRICNEWPGVASMGEGVSTVEETSLELPAARDMAHTTFEKSMLGQSNDYLPLENFHAAAMARALAFLVIWNEHEAAASDETRAHLRRRVPDMANLYNAYANVCAGVVTRGFENMKWYHLWAQYKGEVEKKYAAIYEVLNATSGLAAEACLRRIKVEIDATRAVPALSAAEFGSVRRLIKALIPVIGDLLSVSVAAKDSAATTRAETKTVASYVGREGDKLRGNAMQTALDQVNPTRERFMVQQIGTLAVPGLVKVGNAHIAGLSKLGPAECTYYPDAGQFDAALKQHAADL